MSSPPKGSSEVDFYSTGRYSQIYPLQRILDSSDDAVEFWDVVWEQQDTTKIYGTILSDSQIGDGVGEPKYLKRNAFIPGGTLMIRPCYETALKTLEENCAEPTGGTLIEGDSGVGKTSFLYYVLCERLRAGKPTAFQRDKNGFFLFDSRGVHLMDPSCEVGALLRYGAQEDTWALVDANEQVKIPAKAFRGFSPFFVVEAVSSWSDKRANWMKYKTLDIVDYFMEPWSPEEIRGRELLEKTESQEPFI